MPYHKHYAHRDRVQIMAPYASCTENNTCRFKLQLKLKKTRNTTFVLVPLSRPWPGSTSRGAGAARVCFSGLQPAAVSPLAPSRSQGSDGGSDGRGEGWGRGIDELETLTPVPNRAQALLRREQEKKKMSECSARPKLSDTRSQTFADRQDPRKRKHNIRT